MPGNLRPHRPRRRALRPVPSAPPTRIALGPCGLRPLPAGPPARRFGLAASPRRRRSLRLAGRALRPSLVAVGRTRWGVSLRILLPSSWLPPFRNCSLLDTCSRCYTRIAPWLTSSACVAYGVRRAQHFSASHHSRIAPRSILGLPHRTWIAPCPVFPALCCSRLAPFGSLRAQHFLPRRLRWIAPRSSPRSSHRSRIASRSTLGLPHRARIAPRSTLPALRCLRIAPLATLSARTRHEFLRARHLAFRTVPGSLLADRSVPVTSRPARPADCSALNA
jgi:hypothetical protein